MDSPRTNGASRRAFSLIELLVVVAIIALLIAILLPSLNLARSQAKQVLCSSNMREQGRASFFYATENNDTIVRAEVELDEYGQELHYASILLPALGYDGPIDQLWHRGGPAGQRAFRRVVGDTPTLQCPSFPIAEQMLDYVVSSFPIPYTRRSIAHDVIGGGSNGTHAAPQHDGEAVNFFRLTTFTGPVSPADKIYITEAHATVPTRIFVLHDAFLTSQLPFGAFPRISNDKRHPGGVNTLMFDGHVETMAFTRRDSGWPNPLADRLRWFTIVPPEILQ